MNPRDFGILVEAGLGVLIGLYLTAMGCRWVGKPPGASAEYDLWHQKYGTIMKCSGPFLMALACVMYFMNKARPAS